MCRLPRKRNGVQIKRLTRTLKDNSFGVFVNGVRVHRSWTFGHALDVFHIEVTRARMQTIQGDSFWTTGPKADLQVITGGAA